FRFRRPLRSGPPSAFSHSALGHFLKCPADIDVCEPLLTTGICGQHWRVHYKDIMCSILTGTWPLCLKVSLKCPLSRAFASSIASRSLAGRLGPLAYWSLSIGPNCARNGVICHLFLLFATQSTHRAAV